MRYARFALLLIALSASASDGPILRIDVNDMIHPISDEYIERGLAEAVTLRSPAVLLQLRTPGGLDDSTRKIVEKILASPIPVIIWVGPSGSRAASAGFFILQSADIAAMAPGTNTGAAHPVLLGEKMDEIMKMKLQNDAAAFMRSVVQKRGRNVAVAESAVRESKSFSEDEALTQRLIDIVAPDIPSLLRAVDGRKIRRWNGTESTLKITGKPVRDFHMSLKQRVLSFIMNPNIAFILFSLGMLALWAEFNNPGAILPGVVGLIAIVLAVFALNLLPTRYAAVALLVAAFILFALEAKFVSHGILGAGGVICMTIGALLLVDGPIPEMRVHLVTALAVSLPLGIIAIFLMSLALKAMRHRVTTGEEGMIGEIGIARTAISGEGKVFVHGELWNARSATEITAGSRVSVQRVDGLWVYVEPAEVAPIGADVKTA